MNDGQDSTSLAPHAGSTHSVKLRGDAAPGLAGMALKIGVMGGATGAMSREHLAKAHELGRAIAMHECVLITGGCGGLPLAAACGAKEEHGLVVGISPGLSLEEHVHKYGSPTEFHDVLIFTGSGLMGREVVNIRSSDIVVIIGGRSGTLGELAISYDEGKLIGVLTGTGGISDMIRDILAACDKRTGARVIYDAEPRRLIESLLAAYRTEHHRRPSCFCAEGPATEVEAGADGERDPVCGMAIARQAAAAERDVQGTRYVFCSERCVAQFDADPQPYLRRNDG
jgi:uncharacterized protein (TIGR00725 family)